MSETTMTVQQVLRDSGILDENNAPEIAEWQNALRKKDSVMAAKNAVITA